MMTNILLSVFGKPNILDFEVHTKKFFNSTLLPDYLLSSHTLQLVRNVAHILFKLDKSFASILSPEYTELDHTKEKSVSLLELGIQYSTHNKRAETDENLKTFD